jgi:maltooligosyltrehalose trehalohydrolase
MQHPPTFGAELLDGAVRFRLWAPKIKQASVVLDGGIPLEMESLGQGWHGLVSRNARAGTLYKFQLDQGGVQVPDPASRYQPSDVHGPSEVVDPDQYIWKDQEWRGRPWEECVLYEIHIGTFTPQGTFRGAIERLDWLADLGVTAIEIMPVADFPGKYNWGYDGVLLFAPDSSYGRPEDFKALIDAAHVRSMVVLLDVVYNHFGPDGNYLPSYTPVLTERHQTPWGAAVNYDDEGSDVVRELIIQNAVYWIEEFHLDGLRLDAVHAIKDDSTTHVLEEIVRRIRQLPIRRPVHVVLENEENQASRLDRNAAGDPVSYTAQWNDDLHHVLHCAASQERSGYYAAYIGDTEKLGKALAQGFAFQGALMSCRDSPRGEPSSHLPPVAFISFIQDHDQVGNRAFGDRISSLAPAAAVRAIAVVYLLLPQIPMIFMGEEFGADQPFPFFCDFEPELAKLVRDGRRNEFAKFPEFHDPASRERIPDPTAKQTFLSAKLDWGQTGEGVHADWVRLYRELLAVRHREIVPRLRGAQSGRYEVLGKGAVTVRWRMGDGTDLVLTANLADETLLRPIPSARRRLFCCGVVENGLAPWGVLWSIDK